MMIKNNKLKLLIIILILALCPLFLKINSSFGIYKSNLNTTVNLTVLDQSTNYVITFDENYTGGTTWNTYKVYNDTLGSDYIVPIRTNYNFLGWYTQDGTKVSPNTVVTDDITYYAHWQKIVCKKVTDTSKLHTETCAATNSSGCRINGIAMPVNSTITYGSVPGSGVTIAGDAYDCDVNYDGTYDPADTYTNGKYTERFYFLRTIENGDDDTAALVYYTSFDDDGRVGIPPKVKDDIGSYAYNDALLRLPTSIMANDPWDNPDLVDFEQNGTVSRFLTIDDVTAVCGPITSLANVSYFAACQKWFLFENSRFQSNNLGRAGIWLAKDENIYQRIHTSSVNIAVPENGAASENMVRPVIEIPITALEGYVDAQHYTIDFNTHGGTQISSFYRTAGETLGTLPTPTKEHNNFDGWYATFVNDVYSNPVTSSTVVNGDMTLHAKWLPKETHTVTFDADGGTVNGESTIDLIVDDGGTISASDMPEPVYEEREFDGWYIDGDSTKPFTSSTIVNDDLTVVAAWIVGNYVARVNGVGYETLTAAIEAVPTGTQEKTRVTILKNITLTETISIPNNKWVELDGGNHTISGQITKLITNNGKLDIISGTITTPLMATTSTLITNVSGATLNISGGTLTNPSNNGTIEFLTVFNNGGTLNITGGVLNSYGQSASINNKSNGTINVSGGQIIAHNVSKGQAIYMESGTVNISGDAYLENVSGTGESRATVDNNGGTLNITGGTIISNGWSAVIARKNGSTTRIGTDDSTIDITTPVLRGKRYGLEKTANTAVIEVYDGIFESIDQTQAISTTSVTKPDGINFKTDATVVIGEVTYHAAYLLAPRVTIYFYEETNGTAIPVTLDNGSAIGNDLPTPNPKQDYYFVGWFINGDTLQPVTSEMKVTGTFNAYAKWVKGINNATMDDTMSITINGTDKIEFAEDDVEDVTYLSSDTSVATVDADGTVHAIGAGTATITITGSLSNDTRTVTVTVNMLKYTVTFKDGNIVIKTVEVESGSTVGTEMPPSQTKTGYIFNGWVFEDNNTLTSFTSATEVYGDIEVNASWKEKISIATLPDNPLSITVGSNKQVLVTATSSGGLVEDYTLSSSNTNYVEVDGKTIYGASVGSVTLTITGVESHETRTITVNVVNSYNVTFDSDNGETPTVIHVGVGSTIDESGESLPTDPTKTNYVFDNWYLYDEVNETLTSTLLDTTATVTSDITYKARWAGQDDVAVINFANGPVYYPSIAHALNGAPANTTTEIRIIKDILNSTCSSTDTPATCDTANNKRTMVPTNRNIVLNGGSHTVSCGSDTEKNLLYNKGTLRIISGTFSCGKAGLATLENNTGAHLYIDGGLIENTNDRSAIYNMGIVEITGGTLTSTATERGVVQNATNNNSKITMTGGTVIQYVSSSMGALHNGKSGSSITITGGTVTSAGNAIQNTNGTTLTVGTQNDSYDMTSPVIQGDLYGIDSTVDYAIYDGIIKGKSSNQAVNNFAKITGTESGAEMVTGTEGDYYTLYYEIPNLKYHINFDANEGEVTPTYKEFDLNEAITASDLPTPTRENYTFDGWYTDSTLQTPFATFTPASTATVTYYAKWTFNSSLTPVNHNILSNAMQQYFSNVSSWVAADATDPSNDPPREASSSNGYDNGHSLFKSSIDNVFTTNGCSPCGADNACDSPQTGTYCDQPGGYDTGLGEDVNVYLYENDTKGSLVTYTTSTDGVIYNMIPGVTYYWESATDSTKYGVVSATGNRRTLKTSIRNLRDLGGLAASNEHVSGTIDYGRLYRGAYISSAQGVTDLSKLGITREVDLRGNEDGTQTYKMTNYDTGTSNPNNYTDIVITNYIINPTSTPYITTAYLSNYQNVKAAMRAIMEKVVFNHDSVFFHCTIGTDRTGTMAYFLEGLLGVSEEDRLRDYEMTYFFGLTNRTRFHDSVSWSNINPRFYSMYRSYPTNADIYNYYTYESHVPDPNNPNDLTDDELLRRFRLELIH